MIARLGFSIATEVQADILVCDEVLAVGDFMFQQKCHRRMEEMLSNGTTLLFVSHDINQVQQLCQRSIWLDHGVLRGDGPSREVCADYVRAMEPVKPDGKLLTVSVAAYNALPRCKKRLNPAWWRMKACRRCWM